ncbi:DUF2911 domain-containing protein [Flavobacterium columnare]|uniref:DUF2911 domain-containing protein n=2 Tax=Flavobacterium TaxID=237 RepID=A0A2N9PDK5_9FLAO|nr:DUF2911 domain-containing protein [Flavobacterium columnare]RVU90187.1 DUF2911 domain-containing protein [Flavobacterium columnare]SPE78442.1 hypothetical protein FLACOL_02458 [Flavobacterium columnare]
MIRFIITATAFLVSLITQAQIKVPQASPKGILTQTVGLTEIEIEYSRPSVKGRTIFGDLVPFGKIWRAGANANTTIEFSDDIMINGAALKKGKYALYVMPKADEWEIYFYNDTNNWGTPEKWDETKIALKASAKTEILHRLVETFTIQIANTDLNAANLEFLWEKTSVSLRFEVPTNKTTIASIDKTLNGPTSGDYFAASQYYYNANVDLNKALQYVNKAYEMNEKRPFWYTRLKSQIQAKLGDYKGAIETAKNSLEGAKSANNLDYIKMNEESIREWTKK